MSPKSASGSPSRQASGHNLGRKSSTELLAKLNATSFAETTNTNRTRNLHHLHRIDRVIGVIYALIRGNSDQSGGEAQQVSSLMAPPCSLTINNITDILCMLMPLPNKRDLREDAAQNQTNSVMVLHRSTVTLFKILSVMLRVGTVDKRYFGSKMVRVLLDEQVTHRRRHRRRRAADDN